MLTKDDAERAARANALLDAARAAYEAFGTHRNDCDDDPQECSRCRALSALQQALAGVPR
jgi:hypothetical protein